MRFDRPVAAVDGSARVCRAQDAINGAALNLADHRIDDDQIGVLYQFMLTPNGVNGVDW